MGHGKRTGPISKQYYIQSLDMYIYIHAIYDMYTYAKLSLFHPFSVLNPSKVTNIHAGRKHLPQIAFWGSIGKGWKQKVLIQNGGIHSSIQLLSVNYVLLWRELMLRLSNMIPNFESSPTDSSDHLWRSASCRMSVRSFCTTSHSSRHKYVNLISKSS